MHYDKFYEEEKAKNAIKHELRLTIKNATKLSGFELDAIRTAFKLSLKAGLGVEKERYYTAGIDFPHCCDVLIYRTMSGDYIAEIK